MIFFKLCLNIYFNIYSNRTKVFEILLFSIITSYSGSIRGEICNQTVTDTVIFRFQIHILYIRITQV